MKKEIIRYTICAAVILLLTLPGSLFLKNAKENLYHWRIDMAGVPEISYRIYMEDTGWQDWKKAGEIAGVVGQGKRTEAIELKIDHAANMEGIKYRVHVQDLGWQGWKKTGETAGTTGRSLRMEAIEIEFTGELAEKYNIYYKVHAQDKGWMGWAGNGETAGTTGMEKQIEAIQMVCTPKSMKTPPESYNSVTQNEINPYIGQ